MTTGTIQQIAALAAEGHPAAVIAGTLRYTTSHIYTLARRHGIALSDGARRPVLSSPVRTAIRKEAARRAGPDATDLQRLEAMRAVLADLGVWAEGGAA